MVSKLFNNTNGSIEDNNGSIYQTFFPIEENKEMLKKYKEI